MPTSDERTLDTHLPDAFEYFPDALILADGEARISYLNPAAERLLGLSLGKARGHLLDKVVTLQDGETRQSIQIGDFPDRHTSFSGAFHLLVRTGGAISRAMQRRADTQRFRGGTAAYMIGLRNARWSCAKHRQAGAAVDARRAFEPLCARSCSSACGPLAGGRRDRPRHCSTGIWITSKSRQRHDRTQRATRDPPVAARSRTWWRARATPARLGGDDSACRWSAVRGARARRAAPEHLHRAVESYVLHGTRTFRPGVSIGLPSSKRIKTHHSLNAILAAADAACYQAKRNGCDGPHIQEVALD